MTDSARLPTRGPTEVDVVEGEVLNPPAVEPVDLDAVVDGEIVRHRIEDSPLFGRTRLTGRVVTDPDERDQIAACIAFGKLPWHRRLFARKPVGWRR